GVGRVGAGPRGPGDVAALGGGGGGGGGGRGAGAGGGGGGGRGRGQLAAVPGPGGAGGGARQREVAGPLRAEEERAVADAAAVGAVVAVRVGRADLPDGLR